MTPWHQMTLAQLQRDARQLLATIQSTVSEAPGQTLAQRVQTGAPESRPPTGPATGRALIDQAQAALHPVWDDPRLLRAHLIAQWAALHRQHGRLHAWIAHIDPHALRPWPDGTPVRLLDRDHEATIDRLTRLYDGWHPSEVVAVENLIGSRCTARWVAQRRHAEGLDPQTGHATRTAPDDDLARARELQAQGMSVRDIGLRLGRSKSSVHRMLTAT